MNMLKKLGMVGINHISAPVSVREKVAISTGEIHDALTQLRSYIPYGVILSTCNRTEIYFLDDESQHGEKASMEFMKARADIGDNFMLQSIYRKENETAVEYLFRIASGLESMIIGEFEVLGQVNQALASAEKMGMTNLPLRHVFQHAIKTGRRVRNETAISKNSLSVSSVAIDMAEAIIGNLKQCKMLVIGAGEAGRLVVKVARDRGASLIWITSRTMEKTLALAETLHGIPVALENMDEQLKNSNLVVTCAGAPHKILDTSRINKVMEQRPENPMVIIDIAVPRNVEPYVNRINNVFLYNIDDLTRLCDSNLNQRKGEIDKTVLIIAEEVERFSSWWQEYKVRPLIRAMIDKADKIRSAQLDRTLKKLHHLSDEEQYHLEMMTRAIVTKIMKDPIYYLKSNGNEDHENIDTVKRLFDLDVENY